MSASSDVFKTVKSMVELFVAGKGSAITRLQLDRTTRELSDLVEIGGICGADRLDLFCNFCTNFLHTFAIVSALQAKASQTKGVGASRH